MMRRALLLLLMLVAAQDEVDDWLRQLRSDDPFARDAAEEKLIAAGPSVLEKVRPLEKSADADLRVRAARIVASIERNARRARAFGREVRVSLEIRNLPFREALAELQKKSGFQLWVAKDVEDRSVWCSLKDVPWLEAVSRLCVAHGEVRIKDVEYDDEAAGFLGWRAEEPSRRAHFALMRGKAAREPALTRGPLRLSIVWVGMNRSTAGERFTVCVRRSWQPNARPLGTGGVVFESVTDDHGTELMPKGDVIGGERDLKTRSPHVYQGTSHPLWLQNLPHREAARLSVVRGRAWMWYGEETAPLRITAPAEKAGVRYEIGDFVITLDKFESTGEKASVTFTGTCRSTFPWRHVHGMPQNLVTYRFLDQNGKTPRGSGSSGSYDQTSAKLTWSFALEKDQRIETIEIRAWGDIWAEEFPFEFKDVPLPKW